MGYEGETIYRLLADSGVIFRALTVKWQEKRRRVDPDDPDDDSSDSDETPSPKRVNAGGLDQPILLTPARPARNNTSPIAHTNESLTKALRLPVLQLPREGSPDPLSLYAFLGQAKEVEPYEPKTYKEAIADAMRKAEWQLAMQDEFDSLMNNQTWELTSLPRNRKALRGK